jgi:hypothetical protein
MFTVHSGHNRKYDVLSSLWRLYGEDLKKYFPELQFISTLDNFDSSIKTCFSSYNKVENCHRQYSGYLDDNAIKIEVGKS